MTDDEDLDLLRSVRPDPRPDASATDRHRRQLARAMSGDAGALDRPVTGAAAADRQAPTDGERRNPRPMTWGFSGGP
jgi:hypothetical protein